MISNFPHNFDKAFCTKVCGRSFEIRSQHSTSIGWWEAINLLLTCSSLPAYGFRTYGHLLWPHWLLNDMILSCWLYNVILAFQNSITRTLKCSLVFGIIYAVLGLAICRMLVFFACFDHDTSSILVRLRNAKPFLFGTCARSPHTATECRVPPPPCTRLRYYQPLEGRNAEHSLLTIRTPFQVLKGPKCEDLLWINSQFIIVATLFF